MIGGYMKKRYLLLGGIIFLILTGCGNTSMEAKSLSDFENAGNNNSYVVTDNKENYKNSDYIVEASLASYNDISIEMIVYDTSDNASLVQEEQIKNFNLLKSTGASEKRDKGNNYYKYVLISNNYYMISSRIDNTLIFCKTPLSNKDKVENLINEMGY